MPREGLERWLPESQFRRPNPNSNTERFPEYVCISCSSDDSKTKSQQKKPRLELLLILVLFGAGTVFAALSLCSFLRQLEDKKEVSRSRHEQVEEMTNHTKEPVFPFRRNHEELRCTGNLRFKRSFDNDHSDLDSPLLQLLSAISQKQVKTKKSDDEKLEETTEEVVRLHEILDSSNIHESETEKTGISASPENVEGYSSATLEHWKREGSNYLPRRQFRYLPSSQSLQEPDISEQEENGLPLATPREQVTTDVLTENCVNSNEVSPPSLGLVSQTQTDDDGATDELSFYRSTEPTMVEKSGQEHQVTEAIHGDRRSDYGKQLPYYFDDVREDQLRMRHAGERHDHHHHDYDDHHFEHHDHVCSETSTVTVLIMGSIIGSCVCLAILATRTYDAWKDFNCCDCCTQKNKCQLKLSCCKDCKAPSYCCPDKSSPVLCNCANCSYNGNSPVDGRRAFSPHASGRPRTGMHPLAEPYDQLVLYEVPLCMPAGGAAFKKDLSSPFKRRIAGGEEQLSNCESDWGETDGTHKQQGAVKFCHETEDTPGTHRSSSKRNTTDNLKRWKGGAVRNRALSCRDPTDDHEKEGMDNTRALAATSGARKLSGTNRTMKNLDNAGITCSASNHAQPSQSGGNLEVQKEPSSPTTANSHPRHVQKRELTRSRVHFSLPSLSQKTSDVPGELRSGATYTLTSGGDLTTMGGLNLDVTSSTSLPHQNAPTPINPAVGQLINKKGDHPSTNKQRGNNGTEDPMRKPVTQIRGRCRRNPVNSSLKQSVSSCSSSGSTDYSATSSSKECVLRHSISSRIKPSSQRVVRTDKNLKVTSKSSSCHELRPMKRKAAAPQKQKKALGKLFPWRRKTKNREATELEK